MVFGFAARSICCLGLFLCSSVSPRTVNGQRHSQKRNINLSNAMKTPSCKPPYNALLSYASTGWGSTACPYEVMHTDKTERTTPLFGADDDSPYLSDADSYERDIPPQVDKTTFNSTSECRADAELCSGNLLVNPCGKENFKGWHRLNYNNSWKVETSSHPLDKTVTTNFVSTYYWCSMEQTVNLCLVDPAPVEVSARFMAHDKVPSSFRLQAKLLDARGKTLQKLSTRILVAPHKFWGRAALVFESVVGANAVKLTLHGKDGVLMPGYYGSKVTNCCVRILGVEPPQ